MTRATRCRLAVLLLAGGCTVGATDTRGDGDQDLPPDRGGEGGGGEPDHLGDGGTTDAGCHAELVEAHSAAVDDYDRLLAAATTLDWPFATVRRYKVGECEQLDSPEAHDQIAAAMVSLAFPQAEDEPDLLAIAPYQAGGWAFLADLNLTRNAIIEQTEDGNWDPATHPDGALYQDLDNLYGALADPVTSAPDDFLELVIHLDLEECSEDVTGLLDLTGGVLVVVHLLPRC